MADMQPVSAPDAGVATSSPEIAQAPVRVPFSVVDEVVCLLDTEAEPWSVQVEVRVAGHLDESRLRVALGQALSRHPMARARKAASRRTSHRDSWEITPEPDLDVLRVVGCADDSALDAARMGLQSTGVPLVESPPMRVRLARHPDGDVLMLNVNHAATDGFGALRILRSVARAYTGDADPVPDVDFLAQRDLHARHAAPDATTRLRRQLAVAEKLRDVVAPPARVAAEQGRDAPGYGLRHVGLGTEETGRLVDLDHPGSVNDVLLAALHLAIGDWNARHGVACRRIAVLVPSNLRPAASREETVGNFSLPARVSTGRRHRRTPAAALHAVTRQTRRKKQGGMGTGLLELLRGSHLLPLWAKQAMVALLPLGGNRLVDTAILSNLGRLDDPPSFGDDAGPTVAVSFSAPARMPLGLSVGAVTVNGSLQLVFRHRHPILGPDAIRRFADCYISQLQALTTRPTDG
ncbi:MAG TPA: condensation domain-containing protein [Egibacteraceae bacterium]|nr:condensation domain-containing protein [Egibacteraceae bacterium]